MRALSGQHVWFRGSPEFPLKPPKVEKRNGLVRPMISIEEECSIILRDLQDIPEEYGFMLKYGAGERHIFPERVKVAPCVAKVKLTPSLEVFVTGENYHLTCNLSKRCPGSDPKVTWEVLGKGSIQEIPLKHADKNKYSEILSYTPVPEDHQRKVKCKATFGRNLSASATLTLTVHSQPQILNSSACTLQPDLLTCVCESQGVPAPDIHWPLAQDKLDFTVVKSPARHITVRSTFTMHAGNFKSDRPIMCESRNALGLSIKTLPVNVIEGKTVKPYKG